MFPTTMPITANKLTDSSKQLEWADTEVLYAELDGMRQECKVLHEQLEGDQNWVWSSSMRSDFIESGDKNFWYYTGLLWSVFLTIFTFLSTFRTRTNSAVCSAGSMHDPISHLGFIKTEDS